MITSKDHCVLVDKKSYNSIIQMIMDLRKPKRLELKTTRIPVASFDETTVTSMANFNVHKKIRILPGYTVHSHHKSCQQRSVLK